MHALIDTHCHLADPAFDADAGEVIERARQAGVGHLVVVGETPAAAGRALALAAGHPQLSITAGLHPHEASAWTGDTAGWLEGMLGDDRVVAAGEMGLDYHYDHSPRAVQRDAFAAQLALAERAGKPAVIHAREADDDIAEVLGRFPGVRCVLHSFSSGPALLEAGLRLGHYFSFSGMITFRNWRLDDAIRRVPLDRLLVETDAPYLAPVPHRGKRNEPAFVARTAERLALVRGVSTEEMGAITSANAVACFGPRLGLAPGAGPS
jgi:TatD DNase family protein